MMRYAIVPLLLLLLGGPALGQEADLLDWVGQWSAGDEQSIVASHKKGGLRLIGSASWGMHDPERVERGGVNVGEFDVTIPADWIVDNRVVFIVGETGAEPVGMVADDYGCLIEMALDGAQLLVGDNGLCGGMNVTFTGTYTKDGR